MTAIHAFDAMSRFSPRPLGRPGFPRVVAPTGRDAARWVEAHLHPLHEALLEDGAVLLRGVDLRELATFRAIAERIGGPLGRSGSRAGSTPRLSFWACRTPSILGRTLTMVDGRRVLGDLEDARIGRLLDEPLVVRRTDRSADAGPRVTAWTTSAVRTHPITHEPAFAVAELAFGERAGLQRIERLLGRSEVSEVRTGSGRPIERSVVAHVREVTARHARVHRWEVGDVLVVDASSVLVDVGGGWGGFGVEGLESRA